MANGDAKTNEAEDTGAPHSQSSPKGPSHLPPELGAMPGEVLENICNRFSLSQSKVAFSRVNHKFYAASLTPLYRWIAIDLLDSSIASKLSKTLSRENEGVDQIQNLTFYYDPDRKQRSSGPFNDGEGHDGATGGDDASDQGHHEKQNYDAYRVVKLLLGGLPMDKLQTFWYASFLRWFFSHIKD